MILRLPFPPSTNSLFAGKTPFTPIDELIALYKELGTIDAVAAVVGRNRSPVFERLKKAGVVMKQKEFSEQQKKIIKDYYNNTSSDDFSLERLAKDIGKSKHNICRFARRNGLTRQSREMSSEHRANSKKAAAGKWSRFEHPKGMLGKNHTEDVKSILSERSKKMWATDKAFGIGLMSEESRNKRSTLSSIAMRARPAENIYSRAKRGRRDDIGGMYFRSSWEANYARYLNLMIRLGVVEKWEFEPETFWFHEIKRGVRSYLPDFKVWYKGDTNPVLVEVKGWMDARSKTKLKRMKKYYPSVKIEVVGQKEYNSIKQKWASALPMWE